MPPDAAVITIYTDGACKGNPGRGGWGALLICGQQRREINGGALATTNNRMELQAVIEALNALQRPCQIDLFTDSQYVQKGILEWIHNWRRNGWKTASRQPVRNEELWRQLWDQSQRHQISWHWVKGHSGDPGNERADQLANAAIAGLAP